MGIEDTLILKKVEDYWNWEKLIEHSQTIKELTFLEKERVKRAFQFLRQELGEEFLKDAFKEGHPICGYIRNLAPWTRKWIIWFADALNELKYQENYDSLLKRIRDKARFEEGVLVAEVGFKFSKSGFKITIDPEESSRGGKIPDLKLVDKDAGDELFVEISQMGSSKVEEQASQTLHAVVDVLWRSIPFVQYCGRIHKTLSKRHLNEVVKKVEETLEKVKKDNVFHELLIEDVIEVGMAPEKDKEILEKWALERGLHVGEFIGPPIDVNEILRTKRAIREEQKQLPQEYPNIVVIKNTDLFFRTRDVRKAINELEEEIYEHPHLLFAVISGEFIGLAKDELLMKDYHVYLEKSRFELFAELYIILFNRFCEHEISPSVIAKIYNSFRNY
jgi:ribosomal protein L19